MPINYNITNNLILGSIGSKYAPFWRTSFLRNHFAQHTTLQLENLSTNFDLIKHKKKWWIKVLSNSSHMVYIFPSMIAQSLLWHRLSKGLSKKPSTWLEIKLKEHLKLPTRSHVRTVLLNPDIQVEKRIGAGHYSASFELFLIDLQEFLGYQKKIFKLLKWLNLLAMHILKFRYIKTN